MTHDPLCNPDNLSDSYFTEAGSMGTRRHCDCELISEVRRQYGESDGLSVAQRGWLKGYDAGFRAGVEACRGLR